MRTALRRRTTVWQTDLQLEPGAHRIWWKPDEKVAVGTYVMRLTVDDGRGNRKSYGGSRPGAPARSIAPVVRVLGVEAAFEKRSYMPLEPAKLTVTADCERLTLQFLACGTETEYTDRVDEMRGQPIGPPLSFGWKRSGPAPHTITLDAGAWVSGVYAAKLTTEDGRVGFAPLILRPATLGTVREAVVMPTNTWQAYNFDDSDGDGWGDTWYAGGNPPVRLTRPYRQRGTPPWFRRSDVPFLKFLRGTGRTPDVLAEDDLEAFPSGDELRRLYDLVVFPGHTEYVTEHDVRRRPAVPRPRRPPDLPLGEQLLLEGGEERPVDAPREALARARPARGGAHRRPVPRERQRHEAGRLQDPRHRRGAVALRRDRPPNGGTLGEMVGGYGIEIDSTTPFSPPGTKVLAQIPNLFGPGLTGEMAYYETEQGARVFSAGSLDFGGSITFQPVWRMLDNLWRHMTSG